MSFMHSSIKLLILISFISLLGNSLVVSADDGLHVNPPNWWVGMADNQVELLNKTVWIFPIIKGLAT